METKKTTGKSLENKRFIFMEVGMLIALSVLLFAFEKKFPQDDVDVFVYATVEPEMDEYLPIMVPRQSAPAPKPVQVMPIDFYELTDNDEWLDIDVELEITDAPVGVTGGTAVGVYDTGETIDSSDEPFEVVEKMPYFKGNLNAWLAKNLKYPQQAEIMGAQGRVHVQFIVERDGSITDVRVINNVEPTLAQEAIRVVSIMPPWEPGMQRDKAVRVRFTIPVVFKLQY